MALNEIHAILKRTRYGTGSQWSDLSNGAEDCTAWINMYQVHQLHSLTATLELRSLQAFKKLSNLIRRHTFSPTLSHTSDYRTVTDVCLSVCLHVCVCVCVLNY